MALGRAVAGEPWDGCNQDDWVIWRHKSRGDCTVISDFASTKPRRLEASTDSWPERVNAVGGEDMVEVKKMGKFKDDRDSRGRKAIGFPTRR